MRHSEEPADQGPRARRKARTVPIRSVATYALLCVWALICLFPLYWIVVTSLKGPMEIIAGPFYLPFVDFAPSLDAWRYILFDTDDAPLLRYGNSVAVGLLSTGLTIVLASCAVHGLGRSRWRMPDSEVVLLGILGTRLLPPVVIVVPVYLMAQSAGLLDTRFALIVCYTAVNLPVAVWLLHPVLGGSTDQEEAAQLDGASALRILFDIALPMAAPGIAAAACLIFLLCWNEYLFSVYLAPDHAMTMPPFLAAQMSVREQQAGSDAEEWTHLAAVIVLMTGPLVIVAGFARRFLARIVH
jgi:multiple sugar transport system permease protein